MSPSRFYDDQQQPQMVKKEMMNGSTTMRPSPLKINKESHLIHKSSSSSSSSSNSFSGIAAAASRKQHHHHHHQQQQHRSPVIIYTHSPKIIHTKARDFMALVQKLTGLSHSQEEANQPQSQNNVSSSDGDNNNKKMVKASPNNVGLQDDAASSSVITDENCGGGAVDVQVNSSPFDPPNSYLSDIPWFTPNTSDFFCSARPNYRYPEPVFTSTNLNNSISHSVLEVLKGYPDYCD